MVYIFTNGFDYPVRLPYPMLLHSKSALLSIRSTLLRGNDGIAYQHL